MRCTHLALPLLLLALTACAATPPPAAPELTQAQREAQFWTAYEQRLGMVGKDYADPIAAKAQSVKFGYVICDELDRGADRGVVTAKLARNATADEARVQVDTAAEFLCPQHTAR